MNDATNSAGGGGVSNCTRGVAGTASAYFDSYVSCSSGYEKPAWQVAPGVPSDGARDIPDISLFAANGANYSFYPICVSLTDCNPAYVDATTGAESITGIGGISASAPLMAGIMALIDQSLKGRQGNPNYVFYALAWQSNSVFHDITAGSNNVPCKESTPDCSLDANGNGYYSLQKYSAGTGYDLATGLGSIDVNNLLSNWNNATFNSTTTSLSVSPTTFAHGAKVDVTSVVASSSGMPTGVVSLVASSSVGQQTSYGTLTLTGGTGEAEINSLPAGTYTLTAREALHK